MTQPIDPTELAAPAPYTCKHGCERDALKDTILAQAARFEALESALGQIDKALWSISGRKPKCEPQAFVDVAKQIENIVRAAFTEGTSHG